MNLHVQERVMRPLSNLSVGRPQFAGGESAIMTETYADTS